MGEQVGREKNLAPRKEWFALSSPIGVIGGFTALSELAMVAAAVVTDGGIQVLLSTFAVLFPIGIATAFFYVLWHRPEVLYPPREYGTTSVADYADAMRQRNNSISSENLNRQIEVSVQSAVEAVGPTLVGALSRDVGQATNVEIGALSATVQRTLDDLAVSTLDGVRDALFVSLYIPESGRWRGGTTLLLYNPQMTASLFVQDSVWESLREWAALGDLPEQVESYGKEWAWRDATTGRVFDAMGDTWSREHNAIMMDARAIEAVGIRAGMKLKRVEL